MKAARGALLPLLSLLAAVPAFAAEKTVDVLELRGVINEGSVRYVTRGLALAKNEGAALVVIELNTPGGLLSSTRAIVQAIDASPVPVAVYVAPSGASATSAGTIITMAANFAAMAPGTNIGAAHPVGGQGEDIKGAMKEKAENDTVAFIRGQALLRKRNADWAEQAIRKSAAAPADEAAAKHVVDFLAHDRLELVHRILGQDAVQIHELPMSWSERFLALIGDPNVSYLLMTLGGLGIYVELTSPGAILPGVMGVISLILAFISFSTLPVSGGGVALLVFGFVLFGLEAFLPSHGALTAGGVISLVLGALFLLDPSTGDLRLSLVLVLPSVVVMAGLTFTIAYYAIRSRKGTYGGLASFDDFEGVVVSYDEPTHQGKCVIRGETWDFELSHPHERVHSGDRLTVDERRGMKLIVRRKSWKS